MGEEVTTVRDKHGLTMRQLAFADAYLSLPGAKGRIKQAAEKAGFKGKNVAAGGSKLLKIPKIAAYVRERENTLVKHIEDEQIVTREKIVAMLFEIHSKSMQHEEVMEYDGEAGKKIGIGEFVFDGKTATRCTELLGKTIGMFENKAQQKEGDNIPILNIIMALPDKKAVVIDNAQEVRAVASDMQSGPNIRLELPK